MPTRSGRLRVALTAVSLAAIFLVVGALQAAAARSAIAYGYDASTHTYDTAANSVQTHTGEAALVASEVGAEGVPGRVATATGPFTVSSRLSVAADSGGIGATTAHGAERVAGASATRGGVLSAEQIVEVRVSGQVLTQADGASVSILQNSAGRFDVVVDGSRGFITSFNNIPASSMARLAARYGWE
jgi:hypothetical protein